MATRSSTLAWKIPWMEEAGRKESDTTERLHFKEISQTLPPWNPLFVVVVVVV